MPIEKPTSQWRTDDPCQTARTLGDPDCCPLFVGGSEDGEESEERWTGQARSHREKSRSRKQRQPGQALTVQKGAPGEMRIALDEWERRHAQAEDDQASRDQLRFTELFHRAPNRPRLHKRTDDTAVAKENCV